MIGKNDPGPVRCRVDVLHLHIGMWTVDHVGFRSGDGVRGVAEEPELLVGEWSHVTRRLLSGGEVKTAQRLQEAVLVGALL